MPAELSADQTDTQPVIEVSNRYRLAMVMLAYIPLVHVAAVIGLLAAAWRVDGFGWLALFALIVLYGVPPLAARLGPAIDLRDESHALGSSAFMKWWYATQWQVLFNRLPILEEILRLVPGLYSTWLRLWGARVGRLVYWSPGLRVSDRQLLRIGDRVVLGIDAKLYPHFIAKLRSGTTELVLSPITIGHDALVGGCALLPAGVTVGDCEQTPGGRPVAPFAEFRNGSQHRTNRFFTKGADP